MEGQGDIWRLFCDNMTQLLLLGKFEYTGGPIFKVVLECGSLQYGLVYKMISRLFGLSGLPALCSGPEWAKSGLFSVGQIPSPSSSIYFRSLLPNVPFRPPPLSSSHLKRKYLTGSSSHQIRDITSYCHNVTYTLCS